MLKGQTANSLDSSTLFLCGNEQDDIANNTNKTVGFAMLNNVHTGPRKCCMRPWYTQPWITVQHTVWEVLFNYIIEVEIIQRKTALWVFNFKELIV